MKAKYVRWPGDADPHDADLAMKRRCAEKILRRGPKALRSLVKDGYVFEIQAIPESSTIIFHGPKGLHKLEYSLTAGIVVRKGRGGTVNFEDIRPAATYFKSLIGWDQFINHGWDGDNNDLRKILRIISRRR